MYCLPEGRGLDQRTEVLSGRMCQFHKAKCDMTWSRGAGDGTGIKIWYLISPASELRMSHSHPLFHFKRLLAWPSSGNTRAVATMDFPMWPTASGENTFMCSLSLGEPGTIKPIFGQATSDLSCSCSWDLLAVLGVFCFASLPP